MDVEDAGGNKNSECRPRHRLIPPTGRNRETVHSTEQRDHDRNDDLPRVLTDDGLEPGATWEVKFTAAGTHHYNCTIHVPA